MKRTDLFKFNVTAEDSTNSATDETLQGYVDATKSKLTIDGLRQYTRLAYVLDLNQELVFATTDPDPMSDDAQYELI